MIQDLDSRDICDSSRSEFRINSFASSDPDEHASRLLGWDQTYDQLSPGKFSGSLVDCWFADLQLFREITNQSVQQIGASWKCSRSFLIPFSMNGVARWGHGCTELMDMESPVTLSGSDELDFRTPVFLDLLAVSINADVLSSFSLLTEDYDFEKGLVGKGRLLCETERLAEFRRLLATIFAVVKENPEILGYTSVQKIIQQNILAGIVSAFSVNQPGEKIRQIGRRSEAYYRTVQKAREYAFSNLETPVTMTDLCSVLAVSRRTLHTCFLEVTGSNPVSYLRAVRLNNVRRELSTRATEATKVQDVAARWGFWHLGHFASEYKRMFCERPSETLLKNIQR